MDKEIEMAKISAIVRPAGSFMDSDKAMREYQHLCRELLDKNDWQDIRGKRFPKRSAWRKLSVAYGVSYEIIDRTLMWNDDGSLKAAEFIVRATAPNGRFADGWGACDVSERNAGHKATHDIPATAETRAKNRAAADLFGMGEVSAEEADRQAMYAAPARVKDLQDRIRDLDEEAQGKLKAIWQDKKIPAIQSGYITDEQIDEIDSALMQLMSDKEYDANEEAF